MTDSSQKFIARNRAPRVQIEYDVELYGSQKSVQLPFVMGVMSDLAGKSRVEPPALEDRKFLEIDVDNFDDRMKAMQPRATFSVPNTLTGDGNLEVDLTFESMREFTPAAIAGKIEPLRALLEARTQLANLTAYMDGKAGAEALIERILQDPSLLSALSGAAPAGAEAEAALASLRDVAVETTPAEDASGDVLDALRAQAPAGTEPDGEAADAVLDGLARVEPAPEEAQDDSAGVLDGLRRAEPDEEETPDRSADVLAGLAAAAPAPEADADTDADALASLAQAEVATEDDIDRSEDVLSTLAANAPEQVAAPDDAGAALDSLAAVEVAEEQTGEDVDALLGDLASGAPEEVEAADDTGAVLDSLSAVEVTEEEPGEDVDALLGDLASGAPEEVEAADDTGVVLDSLSAVEVTEEEPGEDLDALFGDLASEAPAEDEMADDAGAALASLAAAEVADEDPGEDVDALLGDLASDAPEAVEAEDDTGAALESLASVEVTEEDPGEDVDALLGDLASGAPEKVEAADNTGAALESLASVEVTEEEPGEDLDALLGDLASDAPEAVEAEADAGAALDSLAAVELAEEELGEDLDDLLGDLASEMPEEVGAPDDTGAALESLAAVEVAEEELGEDLDDLLGDLASEMPEEARADDIDALLGDLTDSASDTDADVADTDLDDILGNLTGAASEDPAEVDQTGDILDGLASAEGADPEADDLDALLGDLGQDIPDPAVEPGEVEDVDGSDDLDDLLGDLADDTPLDTSRSGEIGAVPDSVEPAEEAGVDDLDDLLGDLDPDAGNGLAPAEADAAADDDLDALLGDLGQDTPAPIAEPDAADDAGGLDDLDDLLGDLAEDASDPAEAEVENAAEDDLDDLLAGLDDSIPGAPAETDAAADPAEAGADLSGEPEFAYGVMSVDRPDPQRLNRRRFRIAIMGDFSGRAARGMLETGDALAARRAILLDPDTAEEVIEGFATDLVLPIGKDGAGVAVRLNGLDDLHPDELYENVELFAELNGLRGQLSAGATAENAAQRLREWGEKHGRPVKPPKSRSAGNAVPADLKLSDFQKLIGDTQAELAQPSPVGDLIARVVGPHVRDLPDTDMVKAVDAAISSAMRMILHHPEFQSVEAQWRAIDLIARSIETDDTLDVMLYDISAEEIAADLSAADDLSQSGLVRLLTEEPLDEENGRGGYSALIGLYTFEETPPHAELLGRIARVAAHVDAPFLSAISPAFLEVAKEDRHPIVAQAWDTLRAMPEAGYLGLVSPRFLLRRPYGAKTEPIYEFEFEEFTMAEGMKGMLWANPAVLVAILLARSFRENGASMGLGSVMSLGDMPYHYVTDRYGDQVALPCTERNLTLDKIEIAVQRGYMPVSSVKGRDEVRLTSFQSLAGKEISGPWSGETPPPASPPTPEPVAAPDGTIEQGGDAAAELDDLLADFSDDLDIGDDPDSDGGDSGDIDADLAALLEDL